MWVAGSGSAVLKCLLAPDFHAPERFHFGEKTDPLHRGRICFPKFYSNKKSHSCGGPKTGAKSKNLGCLFRTCSGGKCAVRVSLGVRSRVGVVILVKKPIRYTEDEYDFRESTPIKSHTHAAAGFLGPNPKIRDVYLGRVARVNQGF